MSKELEVVAWAVEATFDGDELSRELFSALSGAQNFLASNGGGIEPLVRLIDAKARLAAAERVLRIYADATAPITGEFARGYFEREG